METKHRAETGRHYKGIPIHAAPCLHESVFRAIESYFVKSQEILELGAGSGAMTARLLDNGFRVASVDIDASDWKVEGLSLLEADFNESNWRSVLPRSAYPQIIAVEVIEHLENPRKFLRDIYNILAPGGKAIITTPNIFCADSFVAFTRRRQFYSFSMENYFKSGHISILPDWLLRLFAEDAGLTVRETRFVGLMDSKGVSLILRRLIAKLLRLQMQHKTMKEDDGIIAVLSLQKPV